MVLASSWKDILAAQASDTALLTQLPHNLVGRSSAGQAPVHELGDIDPPLPHLAFMHPRLGHFELFGEIALGEPGFLPHPQQQSRQAFVAQGMLTLGHSVYYGANSS
jgi:hypothetical protein